MLQDILTWEHVILGGILVVASAVTNILVAWYRARREKALIMKDDASIAVAYAKLNKELREQLANVEKRVSELESLRVAPLRLTTDISPYPEPHVIRSEIVVMQAAPTVVSPPEVLPRSRK